MQAEVFIWLSPVKNLEMPGASDSSSLENIGVGEAHFLGVRERRPGLQHRLKPGAVCDVQPR